MHNKGKIFVCPYGKFPNRLMAARAAAAQGLSNAYNKLVELSQADPLNYYYESSPAPTSNNKSKRKVTGIQNKLETITLTNGEEISWEEFSLWSERKQKTNLIPKSKETREKIRNATIERWSNEEYKARLKDKQIGRVYSDDSKLKMSKLGGTGIMTPKGKFPSIRAASRAFNVSDTAIRNWLWKSKTDEFYIAK
jgi:hypothetical protein